jgi:hypothetical protein
MMSRMQSLLRNRRENWNSVYISWERKFRILNLKRKVAGRLGARRSIQWCSRPTPCTGKQSEKYKKMKIIEKQLKVTLKGDSKCQYNQDYSTFITSTPAKIDPFIYPRIPGPFLDSFELSELNSDLVEMLTSDWCLNINNAVNMDP